MPSRTSVLIAICVCLALFGLGVGPGSPFATAADTDATADRYGSISSDPPADVRIESTLENAAGETTVIVQLADRPAGELAAMDADDRIAAMQSHASQSQTPFERFAAGNPHVEIERQFWLTNAIVVTVDVDRVPLERLGLVEDVTGVYENTEVELTGTTGTARTFSSTTLSTAETASGGYQTTTGLERINASDVWETFDTRGAGAKVAVLDTGYDLSYDDDIGLYTTDESDPTYPGGWAEFDSTGDRVAGSEPRDTGGHGTHVSGTVAGGNASGRYIGVAPDVHLMHGLVLPEGSGYTSQVIAGLEWAVENDADVVSMSLGTSCDPDTEKSAYVAKYIDPIRNAQASGTTVVAAAGNDGAGCTGSPGNVYEAIAVGATDDADGVAGFSGGERIDTSTAWGSSAPSDWPAEYTQPDVVAPGVDVTSAYPGYGYADLDGTSMATPHVAGTIALLQASTDEDLSSDEIRDLLTTTAVDVGDEQHRQGAGRIDVFEAALAQSRATLEPTITPTRAAVAEPTTVTIEADHPTDSYHWSFGDGHTATTTAPEITHTFEEVGLTAVTVELEDAGRASGENYVAETTIDVVDETSPTAAFEAPDEPIVGTNATFDASESTDNHEIATYEWEIGTDTVTTAEPVVTREFAAAGTYDVTLTVTDPSGNANATSATVAVREQPSVDLRAPSDGAAFADPNVSVAYDLSGTDLANASALEYRVTDADSSPVIDWTAGPFAATVDPQRFVVHTGSLPDGNYTVRARLLDDQGAVLPYDDAIAERAFTVKTSAPELDVDVSPLEAAYPKISRQNPAQIDVTATDWRHDSTTVAIRNETGVVSQWDLTAETGAGETTTLEWNATDDANLPVSSDRYEIVVTATDDLENANTSSTTIDVDTDTPTVTVDSVTGTTGHDGSVFLNGTTDLTAAVRADDGRLEPGPVDEVSVRLEAAFTNYRHDMVVERDPTDETRWTATVNGLALPDEGQYRVRAAATDGANNTNATVADESIAVDRIPPRLSTAIDTFDGTTATVTIRSSEPLQNEPTVTAAAPGGTETVLENLTARSATNWSGSFGPDGSSYEVTATGVDPTGNRGTDAANVTIRTASTENRTATLHNERTGTVIVLNTTREVDSRSVAMSETETAPAPLARNATDVTFLTTLLEDELDKRLSNATIAIPVDQGRLPESVSADDDRVTLQWYDESADEWEHRELTVRQFESEGENGAFTEDEYWIATVDGFSTYGVTVVDDQPPELADVTPAAGSTLESDTERVTFDLAYQDALSNVDPAAVDLFVDGERVTGRDSVTITSSAAIYEEFAVTSGESYDIELVVADTAGNERRFETQFAVAPADSGSGDGDNDGGSGGSGGGGGSIGGGGGGGGGLLPPPTEEPDRSGPTAAITVEPTPVTVGEPVTVSGTKSSAGERSIASYEWTINGASADGETVAVSFDEAGTYEIELSVTDERGESAAATTTVTVMDPEKAASPENGATGANERETDGTNDETISGEQSVDDEQERASEPTQSVGSNDTADSSAGGDSTPGFGGGSALIAVLASSGLLLWRR